MKVILRLWPCHAAGAHDPGDVLPIPHHSHKRDPLVTAISNFAAIQRASIVLFAAVLFVVPANVESSQWNPYSPIIAGVPVYCTSFQGQPVAFVPNPALPDVGRALPGLPPTIELNPNVLVKLTPKMQLFWYGHECGHHVLGPANSESGADCWAIKTMRNQGLLAPHEVPQLQMQIAGTPGSMWGHLPGPARAGLLDACYKTP